MMTENAPPSSAVGADSTRGLPYYEQQQRKLRELIAKKRLIDVEAEHLDAEIFRLEEAYLQETSAAGNIIKGFDNYLKASASSGSTLGAGGSLAQGTSTRRKQGISDADRVFSRSSVSHLKIEGTNSPGILASGLGTPRDAPTPSSGLPSASAVGTPRSENAPRKNKKKSEKKEEDDDEKPTKRGKITYGRD